MEFQVKYLVLFFFLSNDDFGWLCMGSLHKNILLILEFLKASFLNQHFSNYILMTFQMMNICNIAIYADDTAL